MLTSRLKQVTIGAIVAAFLAVAVALPARALAVTVLDYDPTETINPVADNITRLNVNKLEKGSRDYVKGAHMVIIEKETGKVVAEWTTDGSTHEVARNTDDPKHGALDVDVVYILRELEAPEGYAKAADTEFVIHSDNFNTSGEIIKGEDAESEEIRGSGPEQAFVINLYDEATLYAEDEEIRVNRVDNEENNEKHVSNQETRTVTSVVDKTTEGETTVTRNNSNETSRNNNVTTSTQDSRSNSTTTTNSSTNSTSNSSTNSTQGGRSSSNEGLTQTGDNTSYVPAIALGVVGVSVIAFAVYRRKK